MKRSTLFTKVLLVALLLSGKAGLAQTSSSGPSAQETALQNGPNGKAIMAYYTAFVKKDWNAMEQILANGFTFSSPLDNHITVQVFKERCWPNAYNIKRFSVDKVVVQGDVAFVITNGWTNDDKLFRNSDCFTFKDGKITSYECFFGPGINYPNSGK